MTTPEKIQNQEKNDPRKVHRKDRGKKKRLFRVQGGYPVTRDASGSATNRSAGQPRGANKGSKFRFLSKWVAELVATGTMIS